MNEERREADNSSWYGQAARPESAKSDTGLQVSERPLKTFQTKLAFLKDHFSFIMPRMVTHTFNLRIWEGEKQVDLCEF